MRRDLCFTYDRPVVDVYNAYRTAIKQEFAKDAEEQCYHTLTFGLNMSFQYNMNGGSCTLHFMPHGNGTAVDVRYTVVQLAGARYGAHCQAMTRRVETLLGCPAVPTNLNVELFLLPENQVTSTDALPGVQSPPLSEPCNPSAPTPMAGKLCQQCGNPLEESARFCSQCGSQYIPQTNNFCTACGAKLSTSARFCTQCGKKTDA